MHIVAHHDGDLCTWRRAEKVRKYVDIDVVGEWGSDFTMEIS